MKSYYLLLCVMAIIAWFSCVSIAKSQSKLSKGTFESYEVYVPEVVQPPDNAVAQTSALNPRVRLHTPRKSSDIPNAELRECRGIVDTVTYLNQSSLDVMNGSSGREGH